MCGFDLHTETENRMANKQVNILKHWGIVEEAGEKAYKAVVVAQMFLCNTAITHIRFWPEDYDRLCTAVKNHGYRADGFRVGNLKAVRFCERN